MSCLDLILAVSLYNLHVGYHISLIKESSIIAVRPNSSLILHSICELIRHFVHLHTLESLLPSLRSDVLL